jgi:hypothetical protein
MRKIATQARNWARNVNTELLIRRNISLQYLLVIASFYTTRHCALNSSILPRDLLKSPGCWSSGTPRVPPHPVMQYDQKTGYHSLAST